MKNTHMYIWKIATIILSFVMIVGLWSGITLDAKAEETQKITEVELIVRAPKAGEDLATVENGGVSVSTPGVKVTDVKWCKGESYSSYLKEEKGLAEYSTRYAVWVQLEAEGNAVFDLTKRPTINGKDIGYGLNDNILTITYGRFPRTETDPGKIIYSVDITVDQPVVGQNLVYTCRLSTSGVRWSGVKWLYTDNRGYVYGPAKYNTEYKVQVELVPETDYKFAPINKIKATINGQADTELLEGTYGNIFVKYTFPAISPEPSSGDYKIIEGNDSNYVPGSNKPLSFRGDYTLVMAFLLSADEYYIGITDAEGNIEEHQGTWDIDYDNIYLYENDALMDTLSWDMAEDGSEFYIMVDSSQTTFGLIQTDSNNLEDSLDAIAEEVFGSN